MKSLTTKLGRQVCEGTNMYYLLHCTGYVRKQYVLLTYIVFFSVQKIFFHGNEYDTVNLIFSCPLATIKGTNVI